MRQANKKPKPLPNIEFKFSDGSVHVLSAAEMQSRLRCIHTALAALKDEPALSAPAQAWLDALDAFTASARFEHLEAAARGRSSAKKRRDNKTDGYAETVVVRCLAEFKRKKGREPQPVYALAIAIIAASHALAGRTDEAQRAAEHLSKLDPARRLSTLGDWLPFHRPEDAAMLMDGLRKAGLPE